MTIVTRFPPSPSGKMHIGSARTALFNWLYAKHTDGKFLLRIEDTDKEKFNVFHVESILDGLKWLGIDYDENIIYQSKNIERHREIAEELIKTGHAYYCYATPEELEQMKEDQLKNGLTVHYDGRWRDKSPLDAPKGVKPTIRLKTPHDGQSVLNDIIQGEITVSNTQIDDMIILRSDGTPTYLLSVVVDDHDAGVNTIIRTSEHLTNTFRQMMIIKALGWDIPNYAHVPLIHSPDGEKMNSENSVTHIEDFKDLGFLPEAICSYLLTLGWSHENDDIITKEQAIPLFDIKDIVKSPAKFDTTKLSNINGHFIRICDDNRLLELSRPIIANSIGILEDGKEDLLLKAMPLLKERAKNLIELAKSAEFIVEERPIIISNSMKKTLGENKDLLKKIVQILEIINDFNHDNIKNAITSFGVGANLEMTKIAPLIRIAISGNDTSPPIFSVMEILGKDETILRIKDQIC